MFYKRYWCETTTLPEVIWSKQMCLDIIIVYYLFVDAANCYSFIWKRRNVTGRKFWFLNIVVGTWRPIHSVWTMLVGCYFLNVRQLNKLLKLNLLKNQNLEHILWVVVFTYVDKMWEFHFWPMWGSRWNPFATWCSWNLFLSWFARGIYSRLAMKTMAESRSKYTLKGCPEKRHSWD